MAKLGKSKLSKSAPKTKKPTAKKLKTKPVKALAVKAVKVLAKAPAVTKSEAKSEVSVPAKKMSQKLVESIERRKKEEAKKPAFSRPMGRRGRRPKGMVEYTPQHGEDDSFAGENETEDISYDTGIRVSQGGDDGMLNLDRSEEFDEELNFDR